jgi:uncharacterized protein
MIRLQSCLYLGEVVHKRIAPVRHRLRYRVFNLFADVDELPELGRKLRWFSYNRFNLFSLHDCNHGPGDGISIAVHVHALARSAKNGGAVNRIFMFCYPRVLGYVFNPLTVYYCFDRAERLVVMIYEVNNTFGERHTYVIPVEGEYHQSCRKTFYVSPFNRVEGRYSFRFAPPGDGLKLGVALRTADGPCLNAYFAGTRQPLTDGVLLRSFLSLPLLTFKIIGAIHWEALKLRLKGVSFRPRPTPPDPPILISPQAHDLS